MTRLNHTTAAASGRVFLALVSARALERNLPAETVVYSGLVVRGVRVGTAFMHNAPLTIAFEGDTANIIPVAAPGTQTDSKSRVPWNGYLFYFLLGRRHSPTDRLSSPWMHAAAESVSGQQ